MAETVQLPVMDNGFGGAGWAAGLGGFVGSMFGNGGWGGWGGNRAGQVGADVALQNGIQNLSNQAQQNAISQLQSASGITAAVNQGTIAEMQGNAGLSQQICCAAGRLSQEIDNTGDQAVAAINAANIQSMNNTQTLGEKLCGINQNISSQGADTRLLASQLASQLQSQHADLKATIQQENCADRELMREIASQAVRDKLAEEQAKNASLVAQMNLTSQLQNQTLYLISQLKPAATTAAAG